METPKPRQPKLPRDPQALVGRHAYDIDGDKVGPIVEVYVDDATAEPEWFAVKTGLLGNRICFVPAGRAKRGPDGPVLPYDKSAIKNSPKVEEDGSLSVEEEEALYCHYGLKYQPRIQSSQEGVEAMQEYGSSAASGEVSPEAAVARLRRRDDAEVAAMFGEDQVDGK